MTPNAVCYLVIRHSGKICIARLSKIEIFTWNFVNRLLLLVAKNMFYVYSQKKLKKSARRSPWVIKSDQRWSRSFSTWYKWMVCVLFTKNCTTCLAPYQKVRFQKLLYIFRAHELLFLSNPLFSYFPSLDSVNVLTGIFAYKRNKDIVIDNKNDSIWGGSAVWIKNYFVYSQCFIYTKIDRGASRAHGRKTCSWRRCLKITSFSGQFKF